MTMTAAAGERYTIRRQIFRLFGAGFDVYDAQGNHIGYCKQRAFRLKEDLRVYSDREGTSELFRISARQIIDFGATYDVRTPAGDVIGSLRRAGVRSLFRDHWIVLDADGREIGSLREESGWLAFLRRFNEWFALLSPQKFELTLSDGTRVAQFRQHFNPLVYRLGVSVLSEHPAVDELMILAAGCLVSAIEGRQG